MTMMNQLSNSNSPYLLQHASNPVNWYPWESEALSKARAENKPIFLSIGYAACHWCHVMAHESFEDSQTAEILNRHYVSIKVDREERPDLDTIYMQAVVAMTGQGGWPLSVFLTPEGQPFYGGTYFPPTPRYNMPAFQEVLQTIARLWQQDQAQLIGSASQITRYLQAVHLSPETTGNVTNADLDATVERLSALYDWQYGGWGASPKFPQPMTIEFLLRRATRGDIKARAMAVHALKAMSSGGMYDVIGGGFARYSTDNRWLIPHFEKMLYDNAQLAIVYLHAYLITGDPSFRQTCESTLDFVIREMRHPAGGFFASLDADSPGGEGAYYAWTLNELRLALPEASDQDLVIAAYALTDAGNFDGRNVLQRSLTDEQLGRQLATTPDNIQSRLASLHKQMLEYRQSRPRPSTDDKVILSWNALMLTAFAEAGRYLKRQDYASIAIRNARFLLENLYLNGILFHSWRSDQSGQQAFLEDYAGLVIALLALYQSDPNPTWFITAEHLAHEMVQGFQDPQGGFFDTHQKAEPLLLRPKDIHDNAIPSGNALACLALLQLSAYTGDQGWRDISQHGLDGVAAQALNYPTTFAQWLTAWDFALGPTSEIAILHGADLENLSELVDTLWSQYRPRVVAAIAPYPVPPGSPALLDHRVLIDHQPTVYICQNHVCQSPITTAWELDKVLSH